MTVLETLNLTEIYKPIEKDIELFRGRILKELTPDDELLRSVHEYLLQISGKHVRSAVAVLSARHGGSNSDSPVSLALAIEILHMATLIHDDIIDGSVYRRNQLTLNAKWGTEISIICGDYLSAKAFSIFSSFTDAAINQMFTSCARSMCEGEMMQIRSRDNLEMNESFYMDIIRKKTASLFRHACMSGAYLSGQTNRFIDDLGAYGENLGLAFQITDDCLDIIGKSEETGKTSGLDIEKSDTTLPLIYLYQATSGKNREELLKHFRGVSTSDRAAHLEAIQNLAKSHGVVERCLEKARGFSEKAVSALKDHTDSPYRRSLVDLAEFTLQRLS